MKKPAAKWSQSHFVNAVRAVELVFPQASVIGLALSDHTARPGEPGHPDQPFRFRMTATTARAVAQALTGLADELGGSAHPRQ